MNEDRLLQVLALGEQSDVEYKRLCDPLVIGRNVAGMLNTRGGYVLIGVGDDGVPTGVEQGDIKELEEAIRARLSPSAMVAFSEERVGGLRLFVVEVPMGADVPYAFADEFWVRVGSTLQRASPGQVRELVLRRQVEPERWERRYSSADPDLDLDGQEVRSTWRAAVAGGRLPGSPQPSTPSDLLVKLGFLRYGRLTNGGDVLFCANTASRYPQVRVRAVAGDRGAASSTYVDHRTLEGPLMRILEQALSFIQQNTRASSHFSPTTGARIDRPAYPPEALREAMVNALVHRDYADFRGGVAIEVFPNRVRIWNSGDFPQGVTPDSIGRGQLSVLRNPDLAQVLYLRGHMERLGRGGPLIKGACSDWGLPPPLWEAAQGRGVSLTLFGPEVTDPVSTARQ